MADEVVATQVEAPEPSGPATEALPEVSVDTPPDPAALKAEIDRLAEVKAKAEEDARYWRKQKAEARADYFKSKDQPPQPPVEDLGIGKEPQKGEYTDYEKYLDDKVAYEVKKAKTEWDREVSRKSQEESRQQRMATLQTRIEEGYKAYPDFEEIALDRSVPITPMVMEILAETERPADLAYYLGKNRMEAISISRMNPLQAARAIAKIELGLAKAGDNNPSGSKIPSAPPPIKPVGSSHTVEKDPDKMGQKEYEAWRDKQGARRF